ncbi:MAG: hypothetical protein R6U59_05260 [Eubacteriales bacterium]
MKKRKNKKEKPVKTKETKEAKGKKEVKAEAPKNLLHLIFIIIKGIFTNIPRMLIYFAVIGVVSFLVHTYLVIYPNGGYWPGTNPILDKILTLPGNKVRGTAFWSIVLYLITSIIMKMRMIGVGEFFKNLFKGPVRVGKSAFGKSGGFLSFFSGATAIFLLLAQYLIKNSALSITLIIGAVLAIITFRYSLSYLFLRVGYNDFRRIFKRKKDFNESYFDAYQLAVIASMLLFIYLPAKPYSVFGVCILALFLMFFKKFKKSNKVAANIILFGLIGLNLGIMFTLKAYGDDGGVAEAGGFIPWITSPGAFTAVTIGLPSAIGSAVGGIVGIFTAPIIDIQDYVQSGQAAEDLEDLIDSGEEYVDDLYEEGEELLDDMAEEAEELVEDAEDYIDELSEDAEDFIEEAQDVAEDLYEDGEEVVEDASDYIDEVVEDAEDMVEDAQDYIEDSLADDEYDVMDVLDDIYDSQFGNPEDKLDSIISLGEKLPTYVGDLINSGQDYVLTSNVVDKIFDTYDGIVPDWIQNGAEDTANELWDNMGDIKNIMDFADVIPKDHPLDSLMGNAGILKDALGNIGEGDNAVYAGIKSYLSNKIKDSIFDKNPGLTIMDTLTSIFAGGTDAADIISPGKTIQGSANLLIDKITDLWNGTNDVDNRLQSGHYGGALKVADDTTEVIADAVYNPKEFKKDFADVITSDEFYDGMYDTNKKLWKPKEGSWAIKRAGCYVGEKTTEGLIKVADGVHELSKWLGSWI